ncbi:MAG: hypothetical protein ACK5UG_11075 [Synechococcaceae cyanobacterium]
MSYLLPQNLTCVAKTRISAATKSQITPAELQQLRQLVVLRNDWTGGISAGVAWLVFLQVERRLPPLSPEPED